MRCTRFAAATLLLATLFSPALAGAMDWRTSGHVIYAATDLDSAPVDGSGATLHTSSGYGLGIETALVISDQFSVEVGLSTAKHDLSTEGGDPSDLNAGSLWIAPVTLTFKWHIPLYGDFQPYIGGGAAYAFSFNYNDSADLLDLGVERIKLNSEISWVVLAGLDYYYAEQWYASFDLRWIDSAGEFELQLSDNSVYASPKIDGHQLLVGLGVGCRF